MSAKSQPSKQPSGKPQRAGWLETWQLLRKLWRTHPVHGVELLFDTVLLALRPLSIGYWLRSFLPPPDGRDHVVRDDAIDAHCVVQLALLVLVWRIDVGETVTSAIVGYCLFEIYLHLLNVVFIGKIQSLDVAPPASIERSILLQFMNVFDVVFAFGSLYRHWFHLSAVQGLFKAVLVLGTIGYPDASGDLVLLVAAQVLLDFVLIILVVSSFVGQLGVFRKRLDRELDGPAGSPAAVEFARRAGP